MNEQQLKDIVLMLIKSNMSKYGRHFKIQFGIKEFEFNRRREGGYTFNEVAEDLYKQIVQAWILKEGKQKNEA